jgi:hypothetical protein
MFLSLNLYLHPVNGDHPVGTYDRTVVTTGAFFRIFHIGEMITFAIHFPLHPEYAGRTCLYAEFTAFATFNIYNNRTSLLSHMRYILIAYGLAKIVILI